MLGRLARWLRLLGFDTFFLPGGQPEPIPDRILLTRRRLVKNDKLVSGWKSVVYLSSDDLSAQLPEALRALALRPEDLRPFSRCGVCNHLLEKVSPEFVAGQAPDFVLATQTDFSRCPGCGRIYWPGTHRERMDNVLGKLFGAGETASDSGGLSDGNDPAGGNQAGKIREE